MRPTIDDLSSDGRRKLAMLWPRGPLERRNPRVSCGKDVESRERDNELYEQTTRRLYLEGELEAMIDQLTPDFQLRYWKTLATSGMSNELLQKYVDHVRQDRHGIFHAQQKGNK